MDVGVEEQAWYSAVHTYREVARVAALLYCLGRSSPILVSGHKGSLRRVFRYMSVYNCCLINASEKEPGRGVSVKCLYRVCVGQCDREGRPYHTRASLAPS